MENKCKDCGCQDCGCKDTFLPVAPCSDPAICPAPQKCEEAFSTSCLIYTGDSVGCDDNPIINNNTPLDTVLADIVSAVCDIKGQASFDVTINDTLTGLYGVVSSTYGPITYKWSIEQGPFIGHTINGSSTLPSIILEPILENGLRVGTLSGITGIVYATHLKLEVTNGSGYTVTKFYTFAKTI
jgi:hypothetical protein